MKTAAVLILAIISQAVGNVYLAKTMKNITLASAGASEDLAGMAIGVAVRAASSPAVWLGTALLVIFFVLYAVALSWADLSFVLPATAFGYVLNVAAGHYFLHETVSPARWAGSAVITLGVILVSKSGVRTVPEQQGADR